MSYYFAICATEKYQEKYIDFLLRHYRQLNLPYSFPVTLSFIASPILMREEALLCFDEDDEVAGALGYIYGTGENDYQDTHIIQIQTVLLAEKYRRTRLFLQGLQYLTQYIGQLDKQVTEVRFRTPSQPSLQRLWDKLAVRSAVHETPFGRVDEYRAAVADWHAYAMKFRHESHFGV
ncbi:hypothetical protein [Paenibacillus rigui]|uniref:GNAT family N-acetyltransferase n=1 Tax=Paenibacillus rigui TaxID=554312 RepID=A0A229UQW8_9BACL|nr:hypothetical protein [Paenibacillus rigui]OXM85703.1 hypothetical protein CF651_14105 [Paenibacillus rigui]